MAGMYSCKKETYTDDPAAKLAFSTDTLSFDTVFTELGSATLRFKVYNPNGQNVIISSIGLKGGETSNFRLNVNGQPGKSFTDVEIRANDSIFIFTEVTIDPNAQNNPFVIFEDVEFRTNGNNQTVVLSAWGQNAYYYKPNVFINGLPPISFITDYPDYFDATGNIVNLPNDKPHVIFGYLMIDSAKVFNIAAGTKLHFYDQSGLWAYRGATLKVNGTPGNEVIFQGTRLEEFFDDQPGQWDRIILNEGPQDHTFDNVIIKNPFIGIQAEEFYLDGVPELATNKVKLYNTTISNSAGLGMLIRNHNTQIENTLIVNSGNVLVAIQGAGTHNILHSTIANFWRFGSRSDETFLMSNYFLLPTNDGGQLEVGGDLNVSIQNSIIYGNNEDELSTDSIVGAQFNYLFENCVMRSTKDTLEPGLVGKFKNMVWNPLNPNSALFNNPVFVDPYVDDFLLHDQSVAIDSGDLVLTDTLLIDMKGTMRDNLPDLGSNEK